uniref:Major facilitator superfamily (MFS) profile domain-containing protein n=1 Tax=Lotharella oceanica TaxID=641309 RepID=A0A7S2U2J4_9EUKA|mmetsp:Transcript_5210/g.10306  ORF Transcript_5210/g.10306 Transcript_5210/m.10306 type:complete len:526 (+) Transcript_5210:81-1658(+)
MSVHPGSSDVRDETSALEVASEGDREKGTLGPRASSEAKGTRQLSLGAEEATLRVFAGRLWPLLSFVMVYAAANTTKGLLFFFFLRSTIVCGEETPADFDRSSSDWSGSRYCNDRCRVARDATLIKGIANGIEHFGQLFCLPAAGVIADSLGRNFPFTVSFAGFSASMLALAVAALVSRGPSVVPLAMVSSLLRGFTDSFHVMRQVSVTDMFSSAKGRGYVYGNIIVFRIICSGIVAFILTATVIAENTYDYAAPFFSFSAILLVMAAVFPCAMRETNTNPTRDLDCKRMSPFHALLVFREDTVVLYIGILAFCVVAAASVMTIAGGYVIGAYGYTQVEAVYILFAAGFLVFLAACSAPLVIRAVGNRRTLRVAIASALIGLCILCFSPISRFFFFLGVAFIALAIMGIPAYMALLSKNIAMSKMGKTVAAVGTLTIIATAIFTPVYAAIFHAVGAGGECSDDTNLQLAWIPWGVATVFMAIGYLTMHVWFREFPEEVVSSSVPAPAAAVQMQDMKAAADDGASS